MFDSKSLFIGPYGENREEFQKLLNSLFEDVMQWRRNFHPEDERLITRKEKRADAFQNNMDKTYEVMDRLLSDMKQSTPFHSPRFLGHMHSDPFIAAQLGYIAGMFFNQNNVIGESSPISTRKEIEFCTKICEMVGFKPYGLIHKEEGRSFSHLTSGGTTAILEAMWVARNLKYYPLSLRLLAKNEQEYNYINDLVIKLPNCKNLKFSEASQLSLFNLRNEDILDFRDEIISTIEKKLEKKSKKPLRDKRSEANKMLFKAIDKFTIQNLGVHGLHKAISNEFGEDLNLPLIYVSTASHYSWQKNLDIIGIGKNQVVKLKCDDDFKIDIEEFRTKLSENKDTAILMVAGMLGTTEEGAVDPINKISELRKEIETKQNQSFYFQVDGAWGGYYCSLLRKSKRDHQQLDSDEGIIIKSLETDLCSVKECDSIVIDPHKMGYIPYSVGSISYKDTRYKDFIFKEAPYLAGGDENTHIERTYLGGWTLEGSRSGATAIACAVSAEVVPLDLGGHGKLVLNTIKLTKRLYNAIDRFNTAVDQGIKIVPAYKPQSNIQCFLISAPDYITNPEYINRLTKTVYNELSIRPNKPLSSYNFVTSTTDLPFNNYQTFIKKILLQAGCNLNVDSGYKLDLIRTVIMHQNLENYNVQVWNDGKREMMQVFDAFLFEIEKIALNALPSILLSAIKDNKTTKGRIKVLWIENKESFKDLQLLLETEQLTSVPAIGKFLDITFYDCAPSSEISDSIQKIMDNESFDFSIIDLDLIGGHNEYTSGIEVVRQLYDAGDSIAGIPILFSKFFNNKEVEKNISLAFKSDYPNIFTSDSQFLGKQFDASKNEDENEKAAINALVKRMFILYQNRKDNKV